MGIGESHTPIIEDTVSAIDQPSKRMGDAAALVHHLYCPISVNGEKGIAKLYVSEDYTDQKTFYLTKIEMVPTDSRGDSVSTSRPKSSVDTDVSIAQSAADVKKNRNFSKEQGKSVLQSLNSTARSKNTTLSKTDRENHTIRR